MSFGANLSLSYHLLDLLLIVDLHLHLIVLGVGHVDAPHALSIHELLVGALEVLTDVERRRTESVPAHAVRRFLIRVHVYIIVRLDDILR